MAANPFDQFDAPSGNVFDQFDVVTDAPVPAQNAIGMGESALVGAADIGSFGAADELMAGAGAGLLKGLDLIGLAPQATQGKSFNELYSAGQKSMDASNREAYQANPKSYIAGGIGGALLTGIGTGLTRGGAALTNSLRTGSLPTRIGKGVAAGAASGALYGATGAEQGKRLEGAGQGAVLGGLVGGAAPAVGAAVKSGINKLAPVADEGLREVGKLAQKYNIPLSLDQITGSRALKNVQKISQEIPLSGQQAFREKQMLAFNKALFKTVGIEADRFTPEVMESAFKKVGGEFDALTKGKNFNIGGSFIDDLATTADDVASTYGKDAAEIFQRESQKVISDFSAGDNIAGELISRQRARINAMARKATDPNIKGALMDLENAIVDGITGGDKAAQAMLTAAKQRYKNLMVLEPIANKAKSGFISPSLLNNRVSQVYRRAHTIGKSGEIGDLARIGNQLLPELGGSDTAQKMAYIGAGVTSGINPATIPAIVGTVGANRAFQSGINRNQSIIAGALNRGGKAIESTPSRITPALSVGGGGVIGNMEGRAAQKVQTPPVTLPNATQPSTMDVVPFEQLMPEAQPVQALPETKPQSSLEGTISEAAQIGGANPDLLQGIATVESSMNPEAKAKTSTATGLFQITKPTWKALVMRYGKKHGFGMGDILDPKANATAAALLTAENNQKLATKLGREPDAAETYTAHFLGANKAVKLLNAEPREIAAKLLPAEASANKAIFYYKDGKPRDVMAVRMLLSDKINGAIKQQSESRMQAEQQAKMAEEQGRKNAVLQAMASKIPQESIQALRGNPSLAGDFNQMYGDGASSLFLT